MKFPAGHPMIRLNKLALTIKNHDKRIKEMRMRGTLTDDMAQTLDRDLLRTETEHAKLRAECIHKGWLKEKVT